MVADTGKDYQVILTNILNRYDLDREVLQQLLADFSDEELVKIAALHILPKDPNKATRKNLIHEKVVGVCQRYYTSDLRIIRQHQLLDPPDDKLFAAANLFSLVAALQNTLGNRHEHL